MKLCYRGIPYESKSIYFPLSELENTGVYRSKPWQKYRSQVILKPSLLIPRLLKFRGRVYQQNHYKLVDSLNLQERQSSKPSY